MNREFLQWRIEDTRKESDRQRRGAVVCSFVAVINLAIVAIDEPESYLGTVDNRILFAISLPLAIHHGIKALQKGATAANLEGVLAQYDLEHPASPIETKFHDWVEEAPDLLGYSEHTTV